MPFNWNDFIEIAQDIEQKDYMSANENGRYIEAYQRMMVVNLYYAVFNLSLQEVKRISSLLSEPDCQFIYNVTSVHGDVRRYFGKLSAIYRKNKEARLALNKLPEDLDSLHELRKSCHYEDAVNNLYSVCEEAMDLTLSIRERLTKVTKAFETKVDR